MTVLLRLAVLIALVSPLAGCYVLQAAHGQWQVMSKRQPIPIVIDDPATAPAVRTRLEQVLQIRRFAVQELKLPDNGSYLSYADLKRPYVVWNVFAAAEFSVEPEHWCFPVAGCVTYRGYFSEKKAQAFAAKLKAKGLDVFVGGVPAYSTLGHFDDPVLNTMIGWSDAQLAAIVFHELTHQLIYVPGDSRFNEALASVVEEEGVKRWLLSLDRQQDLERYRTLQARYTQLTQLLTATRQRLATLYASGAAPQVMRRQKQEILGALKKRYLASKRSPKEKFGLDGWIEEGLNNAHLVSAATYEDCVPGLKRLLAQAGDDLPVFYRQARELARLSSEDRHRWACQP